MKSSVPPEDFHEFQLRAGNTILWMSVIEELCGSPVAELVEKRVYKIITGEEFPPVTVYPEY